MKQGPHNSENKKNPQGQPTTQPPPSLDPPLVVHKLSWSAACTDNVETIDNSSRVSYSARHLPFILSRWIPHGVPSRLFDLAQLQPSSVISTASVSVKSSRVLRLWAFLKHTPTIYSSNGHVYNAISHLTATRSKWDF